MQKPNSLRAGQPHFGPDFSFSEDERKAIDWFRRQFWNGKIRAQVPDDTIAYMLLRVALGHPDQLGGWIDQIIRYREAEGVALSDVIDRKIAQRPEYGCPSRASD